MRRPWRGEEKVTEEKKIVKPSLMIGVPCYPPHVYVGHYISGLNTYGLFANQGLQLGFMPVADCALVGHARSIMVANFLNTDCTHLLMVDSDVAWLPSDVLRMMAHDVPVVGAVQADKHDRQLHIDLSGHKNLGELYDANYDPETRLIKVDRIATCFLMIQRYVFEEMAQVYPELEVREHRMLTPELEGKFFGFFETPVENHRWAGEDIRFCDLWTRMGGEIYLDPFVELTHVVRHPVSASLAGFMGLTDDRG